MTSVIVSRVGIGPFSRPSCASVKSVSANEAVSSATSAKSSQCCNVTCESDYIAMPADVKIIIVATLKRNAHLQSLVCPKHALDFAGWAESLHVEG